MDDTQNPLTDPVAVLSDAECWERLSQQKLGRIVTHIGNVIDIFPVNYVVDREALVFRTAEGSKLFELTVNDDVVFEVDDHAETEAWSVVVRGRAHRLETFEEVNNADNLPLTPWIPTLKNNYVRIEPDRYGVQQY